MQDLLRQIYKTKLQLTAVLLVVFGIALVVSGYWLDGNARELGLLATIAVNFGFTFLTTGMVAIIFEYLDRKHGEERTRQGLRQAVREEAPALRDAVLDSLAFNAQTLKGVASDSTLDRIATNALALRLGDEKLARDLYIDTRDQVINAPERWRDVQVSVSLEPWRDRPTSANDSMFVATIRWEYRVKPANNTLRFACVSNANEYRELLRDQTVTSAWHFDHSSGLDAADAEVFELVAFTVDGVDRKIRRTSKTGSQVYTASLGSSIEPDQEVTVAYTYRVLVLRRGHLLYLDLPRPAKGLHVQLDYGQANIRRVNTLDYFASAHPSRVEQLLGDDAAKTINISFDGWMLPRAGVAFVWVLEDELVAPI